MHKQHPSPHPKQHKQHPEICRQTTTPNAARQKSESEFPIWNRRGHDDQDASKTLLLLRALSFFLKGVSGITRDLLASERDGVRDFLSSIILNFFFKIKIVHYPKKNIVIKSFKYSKMKCKFYWIITYEIACNTSSLNIVTLLCNIHV